MLVAGIGTGILNPETAKTLQAQMPVERAGMASGIGATVRFISLLIGVAALGAVIAHFHPSVTAGVDVHAARGFAAASFVAAATALVALTGVAMLLAPAVGVQHLPAAALVSAAAEE